MASIDIEVDSITVDNKHYRVEINIEYEWENDGIGSYEYWGAKGFDAGNDYAVPDNIDIQAYEIVGEDEELVVDPIVIKRIENAVDGIIDSALEHVEPEDGPDEN